MSLRHSMVSIGVSAESATSLLKELEKRQPQKFKAANITISCINSPRSVTVSGARDQLDLLLKHLQGKDISARQLPVDLAYHSPQMEVIASEYLGRLQDLQERDTSSKSLMMSSVTCTLVNSDVVCKGAYWVQNLLSQVSFSDAMKLCCRRSPRGTIVKKLDRSHIREIITDTWIEIGPHSSLRGPVRDILKALDRSSEITYDSALVRGSPASVGFLSSIGRLYCSNAKINLAKLATTNGASGRLTAVLPDLPQYPFAHSAIHWDEPHSSRRLLFREHPSHDLLGTQVIDWNPVEPKWSFIIKVEELPWIADHKINGSMLYPAAGMLAAVIEAIKMLMKDAPPIGYEIRDVEFSAPLLLTTSPKGTEVQVSLRTSTHSSAKSSSEYEFHILPRKEDESWEEICRGSIRADYGKVASDVDDGKEATKLLSRMQTVHSDGQTSCTSHVDSEKMYRRLREVAGIDYGPSFQVLDHIRYNALGEALATIDIPNQDLTHPSSCCVVHPTTLDGLFQLLFVALTKGGSMALQTMVPTRIRRMWISSLADKQNPPARFCMHAKAALLGKRSADSCVSALDLASQGLMIEIEHLETTAISGGTSSLSQNESYKRICHHMSWKPDLDTMSFDEIQRMCDDQREDEAEPVQWFNDLELMILGFSAQAKNDSGKPLEHSGLQSTYLGRYVSWLRTKSDEYVDTSPTEHGQQCADMLQDPAHLDALCARVDVNKRGRLHVKVGEQLPNLLTGNTAPLELLFGKQDLLDDFYTEMINSSQAFRSLAYYLDAVVHKAPNLEFIEIGAGTGATTKTLLEALSVSPDTPLFKQYTFTDISPSFCEKARETFSGQRRLDFRTLDIEASPLEQGFSEGQYDVLVASLVFHATQELSVTLQQARKLLKPGGKLVLMELTKPDSIRTGFIFGLLPGWWLGSESFRQQSACISVNRWSDVLLENGFSGNDLVFDDYQSEECHMWSIIVSTAVGPVPNTQRSPDMSLVLDKESRDQVSLADEFTKLAVGVQSPIRRLSLEDAALAAQSAPQNLIMLTDYSTNILSNIDSGTFLRLQRLITTSATLIWVARGGGKAPENPHHGLLQGLTRVCRNEHPKSAFVTLMLSSGNCAAKDASTLKKVVERTIMGLADWAFEPEYTELEGRLHINRLVEAKEPNEHIFLRTAKPVCTRDIEGCPPLRLNVRTPGLLDTLEFVEDTSFEDPLAPDEIEVDIKAIGVNFKECLTVLGRVNSDRLGSEFAGVVRSVGAHCLTLQPGDRVAVCDLDCYRTQIRVAEGQAVKIPDTMSFAEAASVPTAFTTAYYSLIEVARLRKDESVLIHAASGGTGQAAIQIAAYVGAEIFATVGSLQKKELLMEVYNLNEDHIFYSRDTSFADGIKRVTKGKGVDVVLNSLSGDGLRASWDCTAQFGRFLEIGRRDIDSNGRLPMAPFLKNLSFIGVDLTGIVEHRRDVGQRILRTVVSMLAAQVLHAPRPLHTYQLQDIEKAFRFIQSGKSSGKIVLEVNRASKLPASTAALPVINATTCS